ncbi:MAG: hypothetical protein U0L33_04285, partial [Acutalibacteraceae bacterium]|nr:hypothetical protein [Acutalibacteraceae bacterium]
FKPSGIKSQVFIDSGEFTKIYFVVISRSYFLQGQKGSFSPAGSVGASALQRCPPDTRTLIRGSRKNLSSSTETINE